MSKNSITQSYLTHTHDDDDVDDEDDDDDDSILDFM